MSTAVPVCASRGGVAAGPAGVGCAVGVAVGVAGQASSGSVVWASPLTVSGRNRNAAVFCSQ